MPYDPQKSRERLLALAQSVGGARRAERERNYKDMMNQREEFKRAQRMASNRAYNQQAAQEAAASKIDWLKLGGTALGAGIGALGGPAGVGIGAALGGGIGGAIGGQPQALTGAVAPIASGLAGYAMSQGGSPFSWGGGGGGGAESPWAGWSGGAYTDPFDSSQSYVPGELSKGILGF